MPIGEKKTYTELLSVFSIYKEQDQEVLAWIAKHDLTHTPPGKSHRPVGAIGGAYTWEFTPTSLGTVVKVRCACGELLDVSDYDNW